jgi:hypothetical protein
VREALPNDVQLVANIMNSQNVQVRRIVLDKTPGLHRVYWNLVVDAGGTGARGGGPGEALAEGTQQGGAQGQGAGRAGAPPAAPPQAQQFGRGGRGGGPQAEVGRYRVVIGKLTGETFTQIGPAQSVQVLELPAQNYILYR